MGVGRKGCPSQRRDSGSRLPGLQAEGVRARTLGSRLLGEVWGPKSPPFWGIEVGGSGPSVGKGPWPAARVPAAGSPGPWRSTAAGWGEVPAWGCASRSGISPHCPLAAEGLCWGDRGTEAGAMGSPASCPFSSMLARSGDREWRGGKVEEGGKSLRGGCGLGAGGRGGAVIFCCCLTSLTSFLPGGRWVGVRQELNT